MIDICSKPQNYIKLISLHETWEANHLYALFLSPLFPPCPNLCVGPMEADHQVPVPKHRWNDLRHRQQWHRKDGGGRWVVGIDDAEDGNRGIGLPRVILVFANKQDLPFAVSKWTRRDKKMRIFFFWFYLILFYFVLFCFILFYFILFYFILFYFIFWW